ncbi:hypothetical protein BBJ28_00004953 [Nothophytophthora sp. Chile5]|nr:hypothetical protein BBJ28_00004953 [Nothophytophthora sp. Chile5]
MGNACACCRWGRGGSDAVEGKPKKKLNGDDTWLEQGSVPLVSARHDSDDIGSDAADGALKKTVLMRSPRPASASMDRSTVSSSQYRTSHHHPRQQQDQELRHAERDRSVESFAKIAGRSLPSVSDPGVERPRPRSPEHRHSRHRQHSHRDEEDGDKPRHDRRSARSTSLEVQDSQRSLRSTSSSSSSSVSPQSPRAGTNLRLEVPGADDGYEHTVAADSPHRSASASESASAAPKSPSKSGSPQKKPRYGRKNYRANSNRKKTV